MTNRILVWDPPTRAFHWLLAAAFVGTIGIALVTNDDSPLFRSHMLLGLIAVLLLVLRMKWGVVDTLYARFGSF